LAQEEITQWEHMLYDCIRCLLREIVFTRDKDAQGIYSHKTYKWFKDKMLSKPKSDIYEKSPTINEQNDQQMILNQK